MEEESLHLQLEISAESVDKSEYVKNLGLSQATEVPMQQVKEQDTSVIAESQPKSRSAELISKPLTRQKMHEIKGMDQDQEVASVVSNTLNAIVETIHLDETLNKSGKHTRATAIDTKLSIDKSDESKHDESKHDKSDQDESKHDQSKCDESMHEKCDCNIDDDCEKHGTDECLYKQIHEQVTDSMVVKLIEAAGYIFTDNLNADSSVVSESKYDGDSSSQDTGSPVFHVVQPKTILKPHFHPYVL